MNIWNKTFARLKDGSVHVVLSDNIEEETMNLIPESQWENEVGDYDAEYICAPEYPYSEIAETDRNLAIIRQEGIGG